MVCIIYILVHTQGRLGVIAIVIEVLLVVVVVFLRKVRALLLDRGRSSFCASPFRSPLSSLSLKPLYTLSSTPHSRSSTGKKGQPASELILF